MIASDLLHDGAELIQTKQNREKSPWACSIHFKDQFKSRTERQEERYIGLTNIWLMTV
jgi:hypothetical protein